MPIVSDPPFRHKCSDGDPVCTSGVTRRTVLSMAATGAALALTASPSQAQSPAGWPSKPIRIIVGYAPGGGTDVAARIFSTQLSAKLGVNVLVENRAGATGQLGTTLVARSASDGHTLLFGTAAELTIAPALTKSLPYNPFRDLDPVSLVGWLPSVLVTSAKLPVRSVAELIAYAKASPQKLNYGSGGNYSLPHLIGLRFNREVGIETVHVPYKGSGPMIMDLMDGQVHYSFSSPQPMVDMIQTGKMRALAVLAQERLPMLPDVPTMKEAGVPGFVESNWIALMAPRGTPQSVIDKLHQVTVESVRVPALLESFQRLFILPYGSTPQQLRDFMGAEAGRYDALARAAGLQPE